MARGWSHGRAAIAILAIAGTGAACSAAKDAVGMLPDGGIVGDAPNDGGVDPPLVPPDTGPPPDLATICGGKVPVTPEDWEDCYQKRECEREVACITLNTYRDVQDCMDSWNDIDGGTRAAARRERLRSVAMHRTAVDPVAFEACLDRTSTTRCIDPVWDAECATRYTGTVADTAACLADVDCASPGAVCDTSCPDACCVGACKPKLALGQACHDFDACQPGLWCNNTVCISGDLGTACSDVLQCDFDYWCDTQAHRCKAKLPDGASCTDILQCGGSETCIGLSISASNPGKCRPNAHAGDPCDDTCFGNLYCDGSSRTCHDLPVLGESCSSLIPCAGTNTICSGGECVLRSDIGVGCGNQTCLPELFCTSDLHDAKPTCEARGGTGAACGDLGDCESHLCSGNQDQLGVCLAWSDTCP